MTSYGRRQLPLSSCHQDDLGRPTRFFLPKVLLFSPPIRKIKLHDVNELQRLRSVYTLPSPDVMKSIPEIPWIPNVPLYEPFL